jgi:hypothetical protein
MRTARSTGNETEIRRGKVLFISLIYSMYSTSQWIFENGTELKIILSNYNTTKYYVTILILTWTRYKEFLGISWVPHRVARFKSSSLPRRWRYLTVCLN